MSDEMIRWVEIIGGSLVSAILAIVGFMFARKKERETHELGLSEISLKWSQEFKDSLDECSKRVDTLTDTIDRIKSENYLLKVTVDKQKERTDEQDNVIKTQQVKIDAQGQLIQTQQKEIESLKPKRRNKPNESRSNP